MILYIQTPSIPRSELHNVLIKTMVEHLDKCNQFSEIRWFVNIDAIKTSKTKNGIYQWEDPKITKQNFINISSKLKTTTLNINISNDPCFYLAFRYLTLSVLEDISKSKLANSEYCVMCLYRNKINMGGNPDIIKGDIFKLFTDINLDKTNKRDPENIRKHDVWYPNIFIDPFEGGEKLEKPPYHLLLKKLISINGNINHEGRKTQIKILSSNVVEGEQGDKWRANLNINKEWDTNDKHGITPNRSYSYK